MSKKKNKTLIQRYKWTLITLVTVILIALIDIDMGIGVTNKTLSNFGSMFAVLPPILVLIGLLDVWVPKETMIKYMGADSRVTGFLIALVLGSLAAGPLNMAFPIAAILMKKQARFANVIFFLGVWSSTKLPLVMYEYTSFGGVFTATHVLVNLIIFFVGALIIEKVTNQQNLEKIYVQASEMVS